MGFIQAKVDVCIPNPLRCYQCQVFCNHKNKGGRQVICVNCSMPEHCPVGQCQRAWEKEKKILKIKCEQNISFPEARKQYGQFYEAVAPSTCNKSTQTEEEHKQMTTLQIIRNQQQ